MTVGIEEWIDPWVCEFANRILLDSTTRPARYARVRLLINSEAQITRITRTRGSVALDLDSGFAGRAPMLVRVTLPFALVVGSCRFRSDSVRHVFCVSFPKQ